MLETARTKLTRMEIMGKCITTVNNYDRKLVSSLDDRSFDYAVEDGPVKNFFTRELSHSSTQ